MDISLSRKRGNEQNKTLASILISSPFNNIWRSDKWLALKSGLVWLLKVKCQKWEGLKVGRGKGTYRQTDLFNQVHRHDVLALQAQTAFTITNKWSYSKGSPWSLNSPQLQSNCYLARVFSYFLYRFVCVLRIPQLPTSTHSPTLLSPTFQHTSFFTAPILWTLSNQARFLIL